MRRRFALRPQRVDVRSAVTLRTFLTPRWIGLHLVFAGAVVGMILLGRWQLQVSNRKHFDLQNFSYVIQWWIFAAVTLWFWVRLIRDAIRPPVTVSSDSGLAVQSGAGGAVAYVGPADLVAPNRGTGEAPLVYRGYAMPHSALTPARSTDTYHGEYNDYLWQLSLADREKEQRRTGGPSPDATPTPSVIALEPAAENAPADEPAHPGDASTP